MDYVGLYKKYEWFISLLLSTCIAICMLADEEYLQLVLSKLISHPNYSQIIHPKDYSNGIRETSVICHGEKPKTRVCRFKNFYYDGETKRFVFVHGPNSKYYGMPKKRYEKYFLDSSSITDHNLLHFKYDDVTLQRFKFSKDIKEINGRSHMFHRFNPENTMHILHDDILPLFHTINTFSDNLEHNNITVLFLDGRDPGDFMELYTLISSKYLFVKDLYGGLTCFEDIVVGLSKETIWYQYGFGRPQGITDDTNTKRWHLASFKDHVSKVLDIDDKHDKISHTVLFSRKTNRKITNELELALAIAKHYQQEVITIDLSSMHPFEVIKIISSASVLIGIHGGELAYSMFMPQYATVIELFPFALRAENYQPYSKLCEILCFNYYSWENTIPSNTLTHPEYSSEFGGLDELSIDVKEIILNKIPVQPAPCCSDPAWLHRIYQDTVVDITSLIEVLGRSIPSDNNYCMDKNDEIYPSIIANIKCVLSQKQDAFETVVSVSWDQPYNIYNGHRNSVLFDVWLQQADDTIVYRTDMSSLSVDRSLGDEPVYIWIRCIYNENVGPLSEPSECKY